ncbi:LysR family transcriptional regulator [Algirhabdus cladophorae]|uniref:LysR family transcriptional regulator n=1 Tax=Algirhabdus cladophorae TaxID=3377108 RepID=UPI003B849F02
MIDLRDMQLLTALSRHKHFAKAATECGISQPAFSMRIRALEDRLGVAIVRRGNRFLGLTPQGELLVQRALGILDDVRGLEQEIKAGDGPIAGTLTLGVVPTALAQAGALVAALYDQFPQVFVRLESASSLAIQQGIEDGRLDAGLSYTDGVSTDLLQVEPVYEETYVLLAPKAVVAGDAGKVRWDDLAGVPLCLLDGQMQNRRILDNIFAEVGLVPNIVSEANGFTSALMMVQQGAVAAILPKGLLDTFTMPEAITALELHEPVVAKTIGLLTSRRGRALPIVQKLRAISLAAAL